MLEALTTDKVTLLALSSTAIITAITPGPNNFTVLAMASVYGRRAALPIYAAICVGVPFMLLSVSSVVHSFGDKFMSYMTMLRYVGMAFLLYIAIHIYFASSARMRQDAPPRIGFWQMLVFQWINPKVWAVCASMISIAGKAWLLPVIVYIVAIIPGAGTWFLAGDLLKKYIIGTPWEPRIQRFLALLLAGSVVLLVL